MRNGMQVWFNCDTGGGNVVPCVAFVTQVNSDGSVAELVYLLAGSPVQSAASPPHVEPYGAAGDPPNFVAGAWWLCT